MHWVSKCMTFNLMFVLFIGKIGVLIDLNTTLKLIPINQLINSEL